MNVPVWDVIVVGAGPAGSTAAALLARRGARVLVLEREEFPRFHIGESLLPAGLAVHEELGLEPTDASFVFKRGARFVHEESGRSVEFDFSEALPGSARHAWHVDRAGFDTLLRDKAREFGATVRHGVSVNGFEASEEHVVVQTDAGPEMGRYLVDATGQDRLVARRKKAVQPLSDFGRAAVFTHFDGLSDAALGDIGEGNDIRIMMIDRGWAWLIPLPGRRLSVGIVSQKKGICEAWLDQYVQSSATVARWTAGATRGDTRIVSNFSFRNTAPYGARYACVGDAACFLDPVFSSGVALAMNGAHLLVERLAPALADGREGDPRLMQPLGEEMERAYDTFASFIHRFYNRRIVENLFFNAPPDGAMRSAVISVLAGDVWRDDNPFQDMLLRSRQRPWQQNAEARDA